MTETDPQSLQASAIDPQLLQAYLATEYTVLGQRPFRLYIKVDPSVKTDFIRV